MSQIFSKIEIKNITHVAEDIDLYIADLNIEIAEMNSDDYTYVSQYSNVILKKRAQNTRFILRKILSQYISSDKIILTKNEHGKLFAEGIFFNISHSRDTFVCIVSKKYNVGVDVEFLKKIDFIKISEDVFSREEFLDIKLNSNPENRFFEIWTRKEAALKALGVGITIPLDSFSVIKDKTLVLNQDISLNTFNVDNKYYISYAFF